MLIDVTDEEREFLERICTRTEMFCQTHIISPRDTSSDFSKDLDKIRALKSKFREQNETKILS